MAKFHDLIGALCDPGDDEMSPTIYDDLVGEYDTLDSGSAAKVAELTEALAARDAEIASLKAVNYDLLMSVPDSEPTGETADDDAGESDESGSAIDALFG